MKRLKIFSYFIIILLHLTQSQLYGESHMDTLYKQIGEHLITIKKEYPPSQPKIYIVLDQVDKMYNLAKVKHQQNEQLKETLKNKELENTALQNELVTIKTAHDETHAKLETALNNLEQEKKLVSHLAEAKKEPLTQATMNNPTQDNADLTKQGSLELSDFEAQINKDQSLNLTSTSDPTSPR